jgi:hypothetical protein
MQHEKAVNVGKQSLKNSKNNGNQPQPITQTSEINQPVYQISREELPPPQDGNYGQGASPSSTGQVDYSSK